MRRVILYIYHNKIILFQVLLFLFFSLSLIVTNGLNNCIGGSCGLRIGQWHMHDALWHISLAEIGFRSYPLAHPFLSGESLTGYNWLIDGIIYVLELVSLNPFFIFFRLLPVLVALFFVYSVVTFALSYSKNALLQKFLIFFFLFGNSATYVASIYLTGSLEYSSLRGFPVVTSIQPTMMFLNIQFALSLALLLQFMRMISDNSKNILVKLLLISFLITGLKFYGGVVLGLIMVFVLLSRLKNTSLLRQTLLQSLFVFAGIGISGLVFYYSSGQSDFPFVYAFMSIPHVMIESSMLFYNHNMTLARYYLYENGGWSSPRLIFIELFTLLIFALVNFGSRIFGVFAVKRDYIVTAVVVVTFLIPILFVQDGGWYNTMQFLYYGSFLSGILAAHFCSYLWESRNLVAKSLVIFVVLSTLPNLIEQLRFITAPQNVIPESELVVLSQLKSMPYGSIYISSPELKNAIVPSLSGKSAYYLDVDQLMVTKAPYQKRQQEVKENVGSKVVNIPADYYYIYKSDEGSLAAIAALKSDPTIKHLFDLPELAVFSR